MDKINKLSFKDRLARIFFWRPIATLFRSNYNTYWRMCNDKGVKVDNLVWNSVKNLPTVDEGQNYGDGTHCYRFGGVDVEVNRRLNYISSITVTLKNERTVRCCVSRPTYALISFKIHDKNYNEEQEKKNKLREEVESGIVEKYIETKGM